MFNSVTAVDRLCDLSIESNILSITVAMYVINSYGL